MATPDLLGTPSDQLPDVLAAGTTDVQIVFVSMSARQADGRDEEYIEWHSLDHRPEQHRLAGLRQSLRLVSTPACRAARAASEPPYDAVDHVMTYFFADVSPLSRFNELSDALPANRRPLTLPSIEFGVYTLTGKFAAPRALVGADVIPWRPALGVYLILEQGRASSAPLTEVAGVAGTWWHEGALSEISKDKRGTQITYCYLDDDPVEVAERLRKPLEERWAGDQVHPLLAAPFHTLVPFDWGRYLP